MTTETVNYLIAQGIYNELELSEDNFNSVPFWMLSDKEVQYYEWLFSKDEYSAVRANVRLALSSEGQIKE